MKLKLIATVLIFTFFIALLVSEAGAFQSQGGITCLTLDGLKQTFGSIQGRDANFNPDYDANNDGKINLTDFSILKRNGILKTECPSPVTSPITSALLKISGSNLIAANTGNVISRSLKTWQ